MASGVVINRPYLGSSNLSYTTLSVFGLLHVLYSARTLALDGELDPVNSTSFVYVAGFGDSVKTLPP